VFAHDLKKYRSIAMKEIVYFLSGVLSYFLQADIVVVFSSNRTEEFVRPSGEFFFTDFASFFHIEILWKRSLNGFTVY
jgi:hypothetical protein